MGFTKLDEGIIYSSIMAQDDSVFRVWIVLLATCRADGVSPITEVFLSTITKKTIEEIQRCIAILSEPDSSSRTTEHAGRRIERVSGGFKILNYFIYREETKTDFFRERMRKQRDKDKCMSTVCVSSASSSSSSSSLNLSDSEAKAKHLHERLMRRKEEFRFDVLSFKQYPTELLMEFFDYWAEENRAKTQMRFELQDTWELGRRISTWARRDKKYPKSLSRDESYREYKRQQALEAAERVVEAAKARNESRDGLGMVSAGDAIRGLV